MARACWGLSSLCLLEEVFLPSSSLGILSLLKVSICNLYGLRPGRMNCILWPKIHINEGLRFPLPPLVHQFLHFTRIHPVYVHVNIIQVLLGVSELNKKYDHNLGLEEVLYVYSFKRHKLGRYYLIADAQSLHLVTHFSNTNKNKPQGNVLLFNAWGYARDPMLREFPVRLDLATGQ